MEVGPTLFTIIISIAAMLVAAIAIARNEEGSAELQRRVASLKLEVEKQSKELQSLAKKASNDRREIERLEASITQSVEGLKLESADLSKQLLELAASRLTSTNKERK